MDYTDVCSGQPLYIIYSVLYSYCGSQERRQKVVLYLRNKIRICESWIPFWTLCWPGGTLSVTDTHEVSKWDHQGSSWAGVAPVQVLPWLVEPLFSTGRTRSPYWTEFALSAVSALFGLSSALCCLVSAWPMPVIPFQLRALKVPVRLSVVKTYFLHQWLEQAILF